MKLDHITLREIRMPLIAPFETSFGATAERRILLVEVTGEGATGWGEVTAGEKPFYNEESTDTAWYILRQFAIPKALESPLDAASGASARWSNIRGHQMATGGLEAALWDWEAKLHGRPLHTLIGGVHREIPCGVSIGIKPSIEDLLDTIAKEVAAGYQRIKIKIKPGWDIAVLEKVRERFPRLKLMADANSAYTLADKAHLKLLDRFYLMMLEQPLAHDDIIDHAKLQQYIETPVCLDESIRTVRHAEQAIE
ncbi:MAG: o-succinylbenzoate synthase, partial [Acidobacteria bacterium RIFCSPLOWO2_02_FULL_60_20]